MDIHIPTANLQPMAAIATGILILIFPGRLNYILAAYLVLIGIAGLGLFR